MDDAQLEQLVQDYDAEQRVPEVIWLYRYAEALQPKVVVEIGLKIGGNLKILSTLVPEDGLAVGMDHKNVVVWDTSANHCQTEILVGSSHLQESKQKLVDLLAGRPIDLLFIDGDHTTEGMLRDYADYSPLVRPGGIIAVHDIYYLPSVTEAWARLPAAEKYESPVAPDKSSIGIGFVYK